MSNFNEISSFVWRICDDELRGLFKDEMIDYTGDRMDFYKKVMDDKVLPVLIDVMYSNYRKNLGKTG